jgi:single-stranded-DNA-specific exonuclease
MTERQWLVDKIEVPEELRSLGLDPLLLKLLYNRGLKDQLAIVDFLNPSYDKLHDPFLFRQMETAVARILQAVNNKEKIVIHGDYDVDGVTSSSTLYKTLKIIGADVVVFIPHREDDGYGINAKNIEKFIADGCKLLITVDCGITNVAEVALANAGGLEVIVTDHHEPLPELPAALAIINPKVEGEIYPFKFLCGAGVAYKVALAILRRLEIESPEFEHWGGVAGYEKWLLDLVAIGTVADIMPLIGENRLLVKYGLKVLSRTRRPGLQKLIELIGLDLNRIDSTSIGFQIAPRLNAAGRLNHANLSFNLLITDSAEKAVTLAAELNETNQGRQKITEKAVASAREQIVLQTEKKMFFVYNEAWHPGIIGLIAGRLADEFYRPVMVMTKVGEHIVGSGRSIEKFNITAALFASDDLLARYGGHTQACGFTVARVEFLEEFKNRIVALAEENLTDHDLRPVLHIEAEISLTEMTLDLVRLLAQFEPFGEGNPKPKFLIKNLQITLLDFLGERKQHLKFIAKQGNSFVTQKFLGFNYGATWSKILHVGDRVDAVVELSLNVWNSHESVEAKILDLRRLDD